VRLNSNKMVKHAGIWLAFFVFFTSVYTVVGFHVQSRRFLTEKSSSQPTPQQSQPSRGAVILRESSTSQENGSSDGSIPPAPSTPAPVLNGKRVLPYKIMVAGLKGHEVAAAYAILSSDYKKSSRDGWEFCRHVGVTRNLEQTLQNLATERGGNEVAHVRALSFIIPNESAMESIASEWRKDAKQAGGKTNFDPVFAAMELDFDEDDEFDDDDDDNDYFAMMSGGLSAARSDFSSARGIDENESDRKKEDVVSPFDKAIYATTADGQTKAFTKENVDKVLDEIRPYLISDGGNCRVDDVDIEKRDVYLALEGACGSCPSSTITMQMGIERVLKENFSDFGQVIQVQEPGKEKPTELTYQVVEQEVNRIKPAIIAMGGLVDIVNVDPIGVVELKFRGANKVRQGLELALLDIDFVKHVKFQMDE
jgi:Fe-S cluster biogenesis protein NfuA